MLLTIALSMSPSLIAQTGDAKLDDGPVVLGHGVGLFKVGNVIAKDDFEDLDNWVVQIQERTADGEPRVEARKGTLDCFLPGRGCTVWFKKKLRTRIAITYDVVCPTHMPAIKGVVPRDINNFWMATDPMSAAGPASSNGDALAGLGLFDPAKYTGQFKSYDKIRGYYASTGGRNNQTTRLRRYPREVDQRPAEHIALTNKDKTPAYLISPDRKMSVQLVAYDDVVQYIVDGKLIYQIARGDKVQLERPSDQGNADNIATDYQLDRFPVYDEGYFGFRMVSTHHVYSNFRVYSLEPAGSAHSRKTIRVDSLQALRSTLRESDQQVILEPGEYTISDRDGFELTGDNNDIDLTGSRILVPLEIVSGTNLIRITGHGNTIRGGTLEDTYPDGMTEVTDFDSYNHGQKLGRMNEMVITGANNRIVGLTMTVRGSFPYGYGNMFGIGRGSVVRLRKHCGIRITGDQTVIDSCDIKMEAFGHAIYVQGGDLTTVRNTKVEGTLRPSNECYEETHDNDLAKKFDYQLQWPEEVRGISIPRDHMINCTEDGIRAYKGAGEMIVENCEVTKCRGGIKLYMAKRARVSDCKVTDCVVQGFSLPSRGVISRCSGNAAYGPLLYIHSDKHTQQSIDIQVLPAPHSLGDHPLAALKGRGHTIQLKYADEQRPKVLRPIIVGYPMRFDFLSVDYPNVPAGHEANFAKHSPDTYVAQGIGLTNQTPHPIVLGDLSKDNSVHSVGKVRDLGEQNNVNRLAP